MKIIIHSVPTELLVQTILVTKDDISDRDSCLFRCFRCGTPISRIPGLVVDIVPGLVPTNDVSVVHACVQCREAYTFQTILTNRKRTRLILSTNPNRSTSIFRCFICRTPLVEYSDKVVATLPNKELMKIPQKFECSNPLCKKDYLLGDVVSVGGIIN
jgi:uncharacterized protein with PIN domain